MLHLLALLLPMSIAPATAASSQGSEAAPPPIINGERTRDYPQVVTIFAADSSGRRGYNFCSGTLIDPEWVLTAAHCVVAMESELPDQYGLSRFFVIVGYDLNSSSGVQETVESHEYHKNSAYNSSTLQNDIGIVKLDEPITDISPMPVNKDAIARRSVGEDYRYIGWGITSDTGQDTSKKYFADMPLYDYDDMFLYGYDPVDNQNVCSGDSGGAVLEIRSDGTFELAGVNSYVTDNDSTPCEGGSTGGTRVDTQLDWIERYTPVLSADEMAESDTDTDTDSDTDTDTDSDTDTDTDTDTDADTAAAAALEGDPVRPADVGENYDAQGLCATTGGESALWAALAGLAATARRRRRWRGGRRGPGDAA